MQDKLSKKFIAAWREGCLCVHPTDTLPGLSVNPRDPQAVTALRRFKQRESMRTFISLVPSLRVAKQWWQPLPALWEELLAKVWPGPLSVVWQASTAAPEALRGEDGTIALRCPLFNQESSWMNEVLSTLDTPLPTTSINQAGKLPCLTWEEAARFGKHEGFYVPLFEPPTAVAGSPSTLIRLNPEGSFALLRPGAFDTSVLSHRCR